MREIAEAWLYLLIVMAGTAGIGMVALWAAAGIREALERNGE